MGRFTQAKDTASVRFIESLQFISKYVQRPFTEKDILELQDTFLTNGFQFLRMDTIPFGRTVIETFLMSLNHFHDVACLTTSTQPLPPMVTNIYQLLDQGGFLEPYSMLDFEEFFLEYFYYDFIWIEASYDLLSQPWFTYFEQKMVDLKLHERTPIIVLSYNQVS